MHKSVTDTAMLRIEMEKTGLVRVQPDQYNYRSPKKYVSIKQEITPIHELTNLGFIDANLDILQRLAAQPCLWYGWQNAAS